MDDNTSIVGSIGTQKEMPEETRTAQATKITRTSQIRACITTKNRVDEVATMQTFEKKPIMMPTNDGNATMMWIDKAKSSIGMGALGDKTLVDITGRGMHPVASEDSVPLHIEATENGTETKHCPSLSQMRKIESIGPGPGFDDLEFAKPPGCGQSFSIEKLEVIVAHNDEDLHWIHPFLKHPDVKVTIYSKGGRNLAPGLHTYTTYLDNIGQESHTYLYHIVTRYDSLSETTLFCHSNPFNHFNINYDPKEFLRDALNTSPNSFVTFGGQKMETFNQWDGIKLEDYPLSQKLKAKPAVRTPAEYWSLFMEPRGYRAPESIWRVLHYYEFRRNITDILSEHRFVPGANFSVQRYLIQQWHRAFWAQVFSEFFLGPMEDINPVTGYICERFWPAFLNPPAFVMYPGDILHC